MVLHFVPGFAKLLRNFTIYQTLSATVETGAGFVNFPTIVDGKKVAMKPIAIITARGGSKGIPGKNLMNFCGLPLIAWSIKQAQEASLDTYVSTEDEDIIRCAQEFGAKIIYRPRELAADTSSSVDVLNHAIGVLRKQDFDTVVLLQPTSPLRLNGQINDMLDQYADGRYNYGFCFYRAKFIEWEEDKQPFPASTTPRRQEMNSRVIEHGMLYVYNENYLPLGMGELKNENILKYHTPEWQAHELDEPQDIEICEYYMRKKILCCSKVA